MKRHIVYGTKFICYGRSDDAAQVTWNIVGDYNLNQYLQNFVFFKKNTANGFPIFICFIKRNFSSRNSASSFNEKDVFPIRL